MAFSDLQFPHLRSGEAVKSGQVGRAANGEGFTAAVNAQSGFDASDVEELAMRLSNRISQSKKPKVKSGKKAGGAVKQKGVEEAKKTEQVSAVRKDTGDAQAKLRALQEKYKEGGELSEEDSQACSDILDELYKEKSKTVLSELDQFSINNRFRSNKLDDLRNKYQQLIQNNETIDMDFLRDLSSVIKEPGVKDAGLDARKEYRDSPKKMFEYLGENYSKTPMKLALALEVNKLGSQQGMVKNNEEVRLMVNVNELRASKTLSALMEHCEETESQVSRMHLNKQSMDNTESAT